MSRYAVLLLCLAPLTACSARALDPSTNSTLVTGGADGATHGDAFSSGSDLALSGIDFASSPEDLATSSTVGVECNGATCGNGSACCIVDMSGTLACTMSDGQGMNACPLGVGYLCDGPEDCTNGRVCVGMSAGFPNGGPTAPIGTRCRMNADPGNGDVVVCHVDSDCPMGVCMPVMSILPGAPALSVCTAMGI